MKISLICPSRGRPAPLREMVESAVAMAADPKRVFVYLALDVDDPAFGEYLAECPHGVVIRVNDEPRSVPALMDELAKESRGDLVFAASDDIRFRTAGWDTMLERAVAQFRDGVALVYTNDGRDRDKCEHFAVTRRFMELAGHFMWPGFEHFCGDEWADRIARAVGRSVYLPELVVEHMHVKYGKMDADETFHMKRRRAQDGSTMSERDNVRMQALLPEIERIADRMRAAILA